MEKLIDEIYYSLQETERIQGIRKDSEAEIGRVEAVLIQDYGLEEENIKDLLFGILMQSEKAGFRAGFSYAIKLLMECEIDT